MLEVANLILVVGGDTTAHEVHQRARCRNCGVKGNNTYQIVYEGNSDIALDGAGVKPAKGAADLHKSAQALWWLLSLTLSSS